MVNKKQNIYLINWLNFSLVVIILMVIIGAITRLTQSGLSISDWRPVMGIFPPLNESQWNEAFDYYKEFPEFKKLNFNMTLNDYKTIYFWEYLHRILGRFIGLLFIFPFVYFLSRKFLNSSLIKNLLLLFSLGVLQGFMGWYMVKSGLVDNPYISHFRLAAHLSIAFIIIAYVYWIKMSIMYPDKNKKSLQRYNHSINFILFLFFIQIVYGAFTAGLKAGNYWNTFPLMEGQFIPYGLWDLEPAYSNLLNNKKMIQFIHRAIGILLLISIYLFSFKLKDLSLDFNLKGRNLVTAISCQVFLGIVTLISKAPLVLAASHQFLAVIILLLLINTKHSLKYKR